MILVALGSALTLWEGADSAVESSTRDSDITPTESASGAMEGTKEKTAERRFRSTMNDFVRLLGRDQRKHEDEPETKEITARWVDDDEAN